MITRPVLEHGDFIADRELDDVLFALDLDVPIAKIVIVAFIIV